MEKALQMLGKIDGSQGGTSVCHPSHGHAVLVQSEFVELHDSLAKPLCNGSGRAAIEKSFQKLTYKPRQKYVHTFDKCWDTQYLQHHSKTLGLGLWDPSHWMRLEILHKIPSRICPHLSRRPKSCKTCSFGLDWKQMSRVSHSFPWQTP